MAQRGRPKSEGELKESSVRIRPALKAKLEAAASESGESIARELEERLEATFTEVPRRGVTHDLLQRIALAVKDIETHTGKQWDKDLTAWAMLREMLANGPIMDFIPDPDAAAKNNAIAANAEAAELGAERNAVAKMLRDFGFEPDPAPILGSARLGLVGPSRDSVREKVEQTGELPQNIRDTLLAQLSRLDELDEAIAALKKQVSDAMKPYHSAREKARQMLYGKQGIPDLPNWLTSPHGLDERPPRIGLLASR